MSIKLKIMIPMAALTIIAASAILISNIVQFSGYVDTTFDERADIAMSAAENILDSLESHSVSASSFIADDTAIINALVAGDRDTLLRRAVDLYDMIDIDFCTIVDASGVALARPHMPDSFGDDVTGLLSIKSALSGKALATVEQGISVRMQVCAGTPIYDTTGTLIGAVTTGFRLDIDSFVDGIGALLHCEVSVFSGDERVSTTILKEDGTRAVGTKAADNIRESVLAGKSYTGQVQLFGRDAIARYNPIIGADGKAAGMLFIGYYLAEKTATVWEFVYTGLILILILLAISIPTILYLAKRITNPIHTMVDAAISLSGGEIDVSINTSAKDEMGELAGAFTAMIDNSRQQAQAIMAIADGDLSISVDAHSDKDIINRTLITMLRNNNEFFSQIVGSATQVTAGAHQIADGAQSLAQGATQQASAVEQLASIIHEIDDRTKENAAMAGKAAALGDTINDKAQKSTGHMERLIEAVDDINDAAGTIGKIIKVIDDIAFQTNILALNAAVEAARAGQHGKGFAVVAEEVRNLAAKSAEAAKDTGALIENSVIKAELGARIAGDTAASLMEIVSGIDESSALVNEIAKSSAQQSAAIEQINMGISQVSQVIQQNSAMAEESSAASEEMSTQADTLEAMVSRFKLRKDDLLEGGHK